MSEERKVGYAYQLSAQFGSETMFQINGNFPLGASAEDMSVEMDKLAAVISRQQAKAKIPQIKAQIAEITFQRDAVVTDLAEAEKRFVGEKLPTTEVVARNNLRTTIRGNTGRIAILEAQLAETEAAAK